MVLNLLGGLAVFLYGMRVMSEGLQKAAGDKLRNILYKATSNRFSATLAGFLVCCAVQSSSATTVMIVGFCSAGLLSLMQSLGMIFGANIGTTTTGWIVSLIGFKVKVTTFALPIIGIGFFTQFIRRWRWPHRVGEVLVGFGLLFLGLHLIKEGIPNVTQSPAVMDWITMFDAAQLQPRLMLVLVGTVLTMIFQSSSAMMAVTLAAAASNLIDYPTAAALVLGENIGTTLTANLASIGAPVVSRQAARGHFFFNAFGALWVVLLFNPFLRLVDMIVPGDPYGATQTALLVAIPTHIAAFHTIFNVINTGVALFFIKPLEKLILLIEKDKAETGDHELVYLDTPLSNTPELAFAAAQKEVDRMAGVVVTMLNVFRDSIKGTKKDNKDSIEEILGLEKTTDVLEHKINGYLSNLAHAHLSSATNKRVISLMSMINDLERMGDHGEKLARLLARLEEGRKKFSKDGYRDLNRMTKKAIEITEAMKKAILSQRKASLSKAFEREKKLNALRSQIREAHVNRITSGKCSPIAGILFSDMITSLEKMGDHAFNVVEASVGVK